MVAAITHMGQQGSSTHEIAALFVDAEVRCALLGLVATGTLVHEGDWEHNMERTLFKIEDEFYTTHSTPSSGSGSPSSPIVAGSIRADTNTQGHTTLVPFPIICISSSNCNPAGSVHTVPQLA